MWECWTLFPMAQLPGAKRSHKAPVAPSPPFAYYPHLCERNGSQTPTATCAPILVEPPSEPPLEFPFGGIGPVKQKHLPQVTEQVGGRQDPDVPTLQTRRVTGGRAGSLQAQVQEAVGKDCPPPPCPTTVPAARPCAPCWRGVTPPTPSMQKVLPK